MISAKRSQFLWGLLFATISMVYLSYMLTYLKDARKCDKYMSDQDQQFRNAAVVITWLALVVTGFSWLGMVSILLFGDNMGGSSHYALV